MFLEMLINAKKSACMHVSPRYNVTCSSIATDDQSLPWVDTVRYLEIYVISSRKLKCSLDHAKRSFLSFSKCSVRKVGVLASEDVVLHLVDSKCTSQWSLQ